MSIRLMKKSINDKQGVVVLSLEQWREIEQSLEDLEMYGSRNLPNEIAKRRKQKTRTVPLGGILKKYHI